MHAKSLARRADLATIINLGRGLGLVSCKFSVQIDRQTNRQTERQRERQIDRQTDRQTNRQTDRQTVLGNLGFALRKFLA